MDIFGPLLAFWKRKRIESVRVRLAGLQAQLAVDLEVTRQTGRVFWVASRELAKHIAEEQELLRQLTSPRRMTDDLSLKDMAEMVEAEPATTAAKAG